ncbi:MAG: VWA domain-containing protein [Candidatus Competibacterales bacterium]
MSRDALTRRSSKGEIDAFVKRALQKPTPARAPLQRLIFALDATASRQPTWDRACELQGTMFSAAASLGGIAIQPAWYRGVGEFRTGPWSTDAQSLLATMNKVTCAGGLTQIRRVLAHAEAEAKRQRIRGLVFVGDCCEEDPAVLLAIAGRLGVLGVPLFMFQEGRQGTAQGVFAALAKRTKGAHLTFDHHSADQLCALLTAVAVYAAGGASALDALARDRGGVVRQLTHQLDRS